MNTNNETLTAGEAVVKAAGELNATVTTAVETAKSAASDHEEVQGWLTTIFKALFAVLK
jgi:hypothetical protein